MTFSCLVIGTTIPIRIPYFLETLKSIDQHNFPFEEKVVAVDDFGEGLNKDFQQYCTNNSWEVVIGPRKGMVLNQIRGLDKITSDWVLYSEDDLIIDKLPTYSQLSNLIENTKAALVSLVGGGVDFNIHYNEVLKSIQEDVVSVGENENFWVRDPLIADRCFVEFPCEFLKRDVWLDLIRTARRRFVGDQIEVAYTKAYFELGYDKLYEKYTWTKDFQNYINFKETPLELEKKIRDDIMYVRMNRNTIKPSIRGFSKAHHV